MYFFQKGKKYRVITPRVDTKHSAHWFEIGTVVECVDVERVGGAQSLTRECLGGTFRDSEGFEQTLYTGDVVAL